MCTLLRAAASLSHHLVSFPLLYKQTPATAFFRFMPGQSYWLHYSKLHFCDSWGQKVMNFCIWTVQRSQLCGETVCWSGCKVVPAVIQETQHYRLADWPTHLVKLFCGLESEKYSAALGLARTPYHSNTFFFFFVFSRDGCRLFFIV